ncbi:MAG: S1 RNA-binding domain-containing protein [bacterium]
MENDIIKRAIREVETKIVKESDKAKKEKLEKASFYEKNFPKINPGIVTKGVVVGKSNEGILISIGLKEEGIIPFDELSLKEFKSPDDIVQTGDEIEVIVLSNNNGNFILSKKRADLKNALDRIQNAFSKDEVISGMISSQVKGGLVVDLGIPGFIPISHIKKEPVRNLESYVGKEVRLKILEFDRKKKDVVLSLRKVEEDEKRERRERLINELENGKIVSGKVVKLTDFGAFVDIGGIEGLIPVSELSYRNIKHPKEVLKKTDVVPLVVIKVDRENYRVSLSLKDALPSPWETIRNRLDIGSVVSGRVSKITPNYAFVTIDDVEGFLPKREMDKEALSEGQEIEVRVIELNPEKQKMTLSLKGIKEDNEVERFLRSQRKGGFTLSEILESKQNKKMQRSKRNKWK